jgi:hypothetical protein
VERAPSWLSCWRQLQVRWDRDSGRFFAFVLLPVRSSAATGPDPVKAMVQVRRPSAGQAVYRRKLAEGTSPKEALRCLKRRLSDAAYRCLVTDQQRDAAAAWADLGRR